MDTDSKCSEPGVPDYRTPLVSDLSESEDEDPLGGICPCMELKY